MIILGLNAFHGDASAAIVVDGQLIAAAEEERFNRIKHAAGFPAQAIRYCLSAANVAPQQIDRVVLARDPSARLGAKLRYAATRPRLALERLKVWKKFATIEEELGRALDVAPETIKAQIHRVEHHQAHLASAFFVSPFQSAALLSVDGLGDFASTMWGDGAGEKMHIRGAIAFPHSLGIYYTALSQFLGFWKYGDEYKVMGLAAYGQPSYRDAFKKIISLDEPNGFQLNLKYFGHHKSGAEMTWDKGEPVLGKLFGDNLSELLGAARDKEEPIAQRHYDIAASLQERLEDVMIHLVSRLQRATGQKTLCMAGGVAYNCVANGRILRETPIEEIYVPAAAGDAGLAIGAAYHVWHQALGQPRNFEMKHAYWGPEFNNDQLKRSLENKNIGADFRVRELPCEILSQRVAAEIAAGKIVGWFQGRMEWGPRALGNRSILVDPRNAQMKDTLNRRIKHRESFRPFAPSILRERVGDYFAQSHPSPFMLMAYSVKPDKRAEIPAPTHVDGTGRLQTVERETNPAYWNLIRNFEKLTGVPVLLNTSFNDNEPVVCQPEQAIDCFRRTQMDLLVLGNYVVERGANSAGS
jgi:carbamoyltransferase